MKSFCLTLAILCTFSQIDSKLLEEDPVEVEAANKMWEDYEALLAAMDAYRKEYSNQGANLIGNVKTILMDSNDAYFSQSQRAYEWASLVQPLLKATMNVGKSEGIKKSLNKILDDGLEKLSAAQEKLEKNAESFTPLATETTELNKKMAAAFEEKQKFFEDKLKEMRAADKKGPTGPFEKQLVPQLLAKQQAIKKFYVDFAQTLTDNIRTIDNQKAKLQDEIKNIGSVKSQIEPVKAALNSESESTDDLKQSAESLIAASEKYRQRHNTKSNLV